jgi:YbbR domain-containing protein
MKAALRWIAGSLPLMVLALILSIISWFVAVESEDPTITGRYTETIPVTLAGLPDGMMLMEVSSRDLRVDLRATQSVWADLTPQDFRAVADLTDLAAGTHQVPIDIVLRTEPADILSIEPQIVIVSLERRLEKVIPVQVQIEGSVNLEYLRGTPTLAPSEVTLTGPASTIGRVAEAIVVVSVEGQTADVEGTHLVRLLDESGEMVSGLTVSPDRVAVSVPIELSGYYRFLTVRVVIDGQVAENHRITDIIVDPATVTVFGAPSVVAELPGFIETEPISVTGATADIIERPSLIVPESVTLVGGQKPVEVTVAVEPVQGSRTVNVPPTIQGLGPGLTATIPLDSIAVVLSGPVPVLEALGPGDVRVVLDLFGLDVGGHEVETQAIVPARVMAQSIFPAVIQVEVSVAVTPTLAPIEGE